MFIITLSSLLNCHRLMVIESYTGEVLAIVNNLVNSVIPSILLTIFSALMYKHLKALLASGFFNSSTNTQLQKSIFRAKITLSITLIFIISQAINWIYVIAYLVCTYYKKNIENPRLFAFLQVVLSKAHAIFTNPSDWSGLASLLQYLPPIQQVFMVINSSANFYAYQILHFKEKKMQRQRNEAREMQRLNASSNATHETSF